MPGKKLQFLVIHCTATPAGRKVSADEIRQWHLGPRPEADGVVYKGEKFSALSGLPPDKIGGVSVYKLKGRGWRQVGYSDMIHLDGRIENLVPYNTDALVDAWEITNGVLGRSNNSVMRHVVYVGGMAADNSQPEDTRTPAQHVSLLAYVQQQIERVPDLLVAGHNQFDKKACPSFSVVQWALGRGIPAKNIYDKWPK